MLLCADLGTEVQPLTLAQLRQLRNRIRAAAPPEQPERELTEADLRGLGYDQTQAQRIEALLAREAELDAYLKSASYHDIECLTLESAGYPSRLRQTLGEDAPPVLFYRGELPLLQKQAVSLTGSRRLNEQGSAFAAHLGRLAAREGYVLVSGNAAGADMTAQNACLEAGGSVIAVVSDSPADHIPPAKVLYICEDGWHLPFSAQRARKRNRIIYALAQRCFVAQTANGSGGTWHGAYDALRRGMAVYVNDDGTDGANALASLGAELITVECLKTISHLQQTQARFL